MLAQHAGPRAAAAAGSAQPSSILALGHVRPARAVCGRRVAARAAPQKAEQQVQAPPATFPTSYDMAMRQAQEAAKAALADGAKVIEVEFPSTSLSSATGDGEGQNEMNASMGFLKQFLGGFRSRASTTRIFFPDNIELAVAKSGQTMDPGAGRMALDPQFEDDTFQLGYLTKQNAAWAVMGFYKSGFDPAQLVKPSDELLVVAYPSFNPREELSAVLNIYDKVAKGRGLPILLFNGELDRVRGGYYPAVFFPEVAKFGRELLSQATQAYYIHNFKGPRPSTLFRCYPGPWQLLRRNPLDSDDLKVVWEADTMPTLKECALELIPKFWR